MLIFATLAGVEARQQANPRALALAEFQQRVKDYLSLRDKARASLPPPKPTKNAAELVARQERLAQAVRAARAEAKPGDVFGPDVGAFLRQAIADDLGHRTPTERAAAFREVPSGLGLKVNDTYPKSVPLATVPPRMLAAMPQLPDGLEYRFVGRRLIMLDTTANLVVDILDNAVARR